MITLKGIRHTLYSILCLVVLNSCETFLDRPPLDRIATENYWKTSQDLENYVIKYYASFPSHGTWSNGYGYPVTNADNLIIATPNSILTGQRGITTGRWTSDWTNIRSVNIFFDNYQNCQDEFETYAQYLGEAHFFRAWFYFSLVKKYGDVPWYSSEISMDSEGLNRPRDPRTLVVDSILADVDEAINLLHLRADVGNNRLNKETALAFKARIALFEGTWQKYHAGTPFGTVGAQPEKYFQACVDAVEELMNGNYSRGIYTTGDEEQDYYTLFGMDNMSDVNEVLFYRAYNLENAVKNDVQYATTSATNQMGVTWELVSSYLTKEGQPYDYLSTATTEKGNDFLLKVAADVDPRFHASVWIPGDLRWANPEHRFSKPSIDKVDLVLNPTGFQLKKCSNPYAAGNLGGGSSETGYILFRYGETLLNYAEAKYELDGTITYGVLNQLRSRVGMAEFQVFPQSSDPNWVDYGYPISDALYEIRRERRVELALEGHREDDYRRWAAHSLFQGKRPKGYPFEQSEFPEYHPPLDEHGLIDYYQKIIPNGYLFREDQDYLSPIPEEEFTLNPNLDQNPNW